jgi:flagellar motor component MotA
LEEIKPMNENDFMEEYNAIFERLLIFSIIASSMGLVSLENLLDKEKYNQRDIFEYGIRLVMDGRGPELTNKIFTNLINLEPDKERKILKNIQKDAVLAIQEGISPKDLMCVMNSYVRIDLDKATEKLDEINEFIEKAFVDLMPNRHDEYLEIYQKLAEKVVNVFYKGKKNNY